MYSPANEPWYILIVATNEQCCMKSVSRVLLSSDTPSNVAWYIHTKSRHVHAVSTNEPWRIHNPYLECVINSLRISHLSIFVFSSGIASLASTFSRVL